MFEEEMEPIPDLATNVLKRMAVIEVQHRRVAIEVGLWSDWFWDNFQMLWNAVWYEREARFWSCRGGDPP